MSRRPLPEHLADFLLSQGDPKLKAYRQKCLAYWRATYGEAVVIEVEKLVTKRWRARGADIS